MKRFIFALPLILAVAEITVSSAAELRENHVLPQTLPKSSHRQTGKIVKSPSGVPMPVPPRTGSRYKTALEVLKKEQGIELKRGVILEVRKGKYILTFAERSLTRQYEKVKIFYRERKKLINETKRTRYIPVFTPGAAGDEVMVSSGGQTISKRLSSNGKILFDTKDFPAVSYDGKPLEFTFIHRRWGQRWTFRTVSIIEPAAIRDWNIFADEKCNYSTRFKALRRLEPMLGEKRCRMYLGKLLAGDLKLRPIIRAEIAIVGDSAAPGKKNAAARPGAEGYAMGLWYEKANKNLAMAWFRQAAEQGHPESQFKIGSSCLDGDGVTQNFDEAVKWFRKAAKQGHPEAQFKVGSCYYHGKGVAQDLFKAFGWWDKAARQGHPEVQFQMGELYGKGVAQNLFLWCIATEQGHPEAQSQMGELYGRFENAAAMKAFCRREKIKYRAEWEAQAQHRRGRFIYEIPSKVLAIEWYRKAAEQGHAGAQFKLGEYYRDGVDTSSLFPLLEKDLAEAVKWYRKAAEQGHLEAKEKLEEEIEIEKRQREEEEEEDRLRPRRHEKEEENRRRIREIREQEKKLHMSSGDGSPRSAVYTPVPPPTLIYQPGCVPQKGVVYVAPTQVYTPVPPPTLVYQPGKSRYRR